MCTSDCLSCCFVFNVLLRRLKTLQSLGRLAGRCFWLMRSLFLFTILVGNQSLYCLVMWLKWHLLKTLEEESSRSQVRCIERISLLQPILGTRRIRVPRLREESEKESRDVTVCGLRIQRRHCHFLSVLTLVLKRTKKTRCWKMT